MEIFSIIEKVGLGHQNSFSKKIEFPRDVSWAWLTWPDVYQYKFAVQICVLTNGMLTNSIIFNL